MSEIIISDQGVKSMIDFTMVLYGNIFLVHETQKRQQDGVTDDEGVH